MKRILFGLIAVLLFASCNKKEKSDFSLNGTTNKIDDGTIVYLSNDQFTDSTIVKNNSFSFKRELSNSPIQAILHTKDYSQYRFLWLEKNVMLFDGANSDFFHANVTGSESEILSQNLSNAIDTLPRKQRQKLEIEFVNNNPNSIVSASTLAVYTTTWGKEKTVELFNKFSIENKNSEFGKKISKYIELNKDPKIGDVFADFEMLSQNGKKKKLSDIKNKIILLEFWASWCGPCRKENPNLVKTYEAYKPSGFEVFAVSLDENKDHWIKAIEDDNLNWEHVSDLKGSSNEASLIYGITGIPDNFMIDKNGIIIGRNLRGEDLDKKLAELISLKN